MLKIAKNKDILSITLSLEKNSCHRYKDVIKMLHFVGKYFFENKFLGNFKMISIIGVSSLFPMLIRNGCKYFCVVFFL